jgi:glutaredoxin-like protein
MAPFLNDEISSQVKSIFSHLDHPVEILFFGKQAGCDYCPETAQLLTEVVSFSDLFTLNIYDLEENADLAQKYKIDKAPGFVITAKESGQLTDFGIRYFGIPSGHEFTSLINDLVMVSSRNSALSEKTRQFLKDLDKPTLLQVFVTPSCPYCPQAVVLAHQMAMESPYVEAEMVEATEFFDLASEYGVSGVPNTIINRGAGSLVGAAPEENLVGEILRVLKEKDHVTR